MVEEKQHGLQEAGHNASAQHGNAMAQGVPCKALAEENRSQRKQQSRHLMELHAFNRTTRPLYLAQLKSTWPSRICSCSAERLPFQIKPHFLLLNFRSFS